MRIIVDAMGGDNAPESAVWGGALAANLSLILGAASVIIWLLLGTPFGIHVAIVGLPMAGLGYLIGMAVGDKPTEAQLKAIADAGMKVSN